MSKRRLTALIMSLVLAVTVGAFLLSACDDGSSPLGKGVTRPEPVYTNNLDKTEGENLALSATISASSAADGVAALTDGDTTTAWTAESSSDEYIEIAFDSPVTVNTIVLRENGNYITSFRFLVKDGDSWTEFYRQDRVERYRYCTFDEVTASAVRIVFDGADEGRGISIAELEIFDLGAKKYDEEFRVFGYFNIADYERAKNSPEEYAKFSAQLDVVTDIIIFNFTYWNEDGDIVFATVEDADGNPVDGEEYFAECVDFVRETAGARGINICVDFWPTKTGDIFNHGLPGNLSALADNLAAFAEKYSLEGLDFDWEYPSNPDEWFSYGELFRALKERLGDRTYVTVALSSYNVRFTDEQIEAIDYVQIMGYDRFDLDGNNSSFRSGAYLPMRYFVNLGFEPSQLVAGMPLYGRPHPDDEEPGGTWTDYWFDGGKVYGSEDKTTPYTYWDNTQWIEYNGAMLKVYVTGPAMAADKTAYAIEQSFAGIMVFRNMEDFPFDDELSVMRAIGETIDSRVTY